MKKLRVAIDVDDTIASTQDAMVRLYNLGRATKIAADDITDWEWGSLGLTDEQIDNLYVEAWLNADHIRLLADVGLLLDVSKNNDVEFVTSRKNNPKKMTTVPQLRSWLSQNGLGQIKLVLSDQYSEKSLLDYEVYIDDSPSLAEDIARMESKFMFLVDAPYNRHIKDTDRVKRIEGVNEGLATLANGTLSGFKHK